MSTLSHNPDVTLHTLWKPRLLTLAALVSQLALLAAAFWLALAIRSDFAATGWVAAYFLPLLPLLLAIKLAVWLPLGLHRGTAWRHTSLGDAIRLLAGGVLSLGLTIAAYNAWQLWAHWAGRSMAAGLPETLFILDFLLSITLLGGIRIATRLVYEESRPVAPGGIVRLLIIGAGDAAAAVLREIARMPEQRYRVIGLLDDDAAKARTRIHGTPVLGPISTLPRICRHHQIGEILIAMPSANNLEMQRIISLCRATQMEADVHGTAATGNQAAPIRFRTVPSLQDILAGKAAATQIREVSVNDVLGRDAVDMDLAAVGAMLHGQVVLVSGAGGSIGSELCRTICRFEPQQLVLVDKAENAIFEIERELRRNFPAVNLIPAIGDITDTVRVEQVFNDYLPSIVFHAAAHKHVPLAELNPGEAIRNNVFGTKTLADTAAAFGVKNFVMISTDKAVNPSSIMGATKRCAEIYIQGLARRPLKTQDSRFRTNFITVRFGNVLGSNGSVVPIFKQQIAAGGPVTVTHPEMRRYFMTIPEASQLVLQAGALGQRGEIFVLDMGKPVRILDLARDLIILSGLRPDVDIPIVFTGLRPGEKLYEELSTRGEHMAQTRHPKIAVWTPSLNIADPAQIQRMMDELETLQHCTDRRRALSTLKVFVPEMKPWEAEETRGSKQETRNVD
ncbi:MAG TPA: nucleoside-diphosphate sugar epimerase/dehydratase [Phycisphaerae bacterium]|nr:nucleoside-diphosphate sugar epimerase/dehydratase [Phycisphaerae bacterium]